MPNISLGDLQYRCYQDLDNNTLLYPLPELTAYINESIQVINNITGMLQEQIVLDVASQATRVWSDIPSSHILVPFKLEYDGRYLLSRMSLQKIGQLYPYWLTERTATIGSPVARWVPVGLTKFGLHPADSRGGAQMRLSGIKVPVPLANQADVMPFPNEYADAVEDLTVMAIQLKEIMPIQQAMQQAYPRFIDKMQSQSKWRNVMQPAYYQDRRSRK